MPSIYTFKNVRNFVHIFLSDFHTFFNDYFLWFFIFFFELQVFLFSGLYCLFVRYVAILRKMFFFCDITLCQKHLNREKNVWKSDGKNMYEIPNVFISVDGRHLSVQCIWCLVRDKIDFNLTVIVSLW